MLKYRPTPHVETDGQARVLDPHDLISGVRKASACIINDRSGKLRREPAICVSDDDGYLSFGGAFLDCAEQGHVRAVRIAHFQDYQRVDQVCRQRLFEPRTRAASSYPDQDQSGI